VDFSAEPQDHPSIEGGWTLYVDGFSSKKGSGAGIVLEGPANVKIEQYLVLTLAEDVGAKKISCKADSQLIIGQLKGGFQVKEPLLLKYHSIAKQKMENFVEIKFKHVPQV